MIKSVQKIINKKICSGCYLCMNVCPQECIKMFLNKEGFYYPYINAEKCNNCGICLNKCPVSSKYNLKSLSYTKAYMAKSLDDDLKIRSSSGGIFGEIAKYVLSKKGIVYGAAFNAKNEVVHIGIENKKDLYKLIGSKYLQSNIGFIYKDVKRNLLKNKYVLFVGLPCQVNAVRNYIGENKYLILVDLICHGVPSQTIFKKYLQYIFGNEKVKKISFRDKMDNRDWQNFKIKIVGSSSTYLKSHKKDPFFYGYLKNLYLNDICYSCVFCRIPRVSDITLGDYWGVPKELKDTEGTSLVIVNSNIGEEIINKLYNHGRIHLEETNIENAAKHNPRLVRGKLNIPNERKKIFDNINDISFDEINKKFIKSFDDDVYKYFKNTIKNRKIIVFGTGKACHEILSKNEIVNFKDIEYFIDNDKKKCGLEIKNKKIYGIEKLKYEDTGDIFIIIASSYYDEISEQLKTIGFKENIDFIDGIKYLLCD